MLKPVESFLKLVKKRLDLENKQWDELVTQLQKEFPKVPKELVDQERKRWREERDNFITNKGLRRLNTRIRMEKLIK